MNYTKLAGLLLLASLFSCSKGAGDKTAKKEIPPVTVDVIIAENLDFPSTVEVNGTVLSEEMIELRPEISGRLTFLNIPDGANVTTGTLLAKINDADLQAQLAEIQVKLDLAEKNEGRLEPLLKSKAIDPATYDEALSQVNLLKANMNLVRAQIDKTIIKAPFSGKLGLRLVSQGAYVTPATIIGTLQQTDKIKIDFTVPEAYKELVTVGKVVNIKTTSVITLQNATISAVEPQINIATRNIKVRARLENSDLNPGAFVKVLLDNRENGIVVPTQVLIPDALANQVVVVRSGKASFQSVETGIRTASAVQLTSGVFPGDTIVVNGVLFVRPNSKIKIRSIKKLAEVIKS